jgi:hypothetical protein
MHGPAFKGVSYDSPDELLAASFELTRAATI